MRNVTLKIRNVFFCKFSVLMIYYGLHAQRVFLQRFDPPGSHA